MRVHFLDFSHDFPVPYTVMGCGATFDGCEAKNPYLEDMVL